MQWPVEKFGEENVKGRQNKAEAILLGKGEENREKTSPLQRWYQLEPSILDARRGPGEPWEKLPTTGRSNRDRQERCQWKPPSMQVGER